MNGRVYVKKKFGGIVPPNPKTKMPKHPEPTPQEIFRGIIKNAISTAVRKHGFRTYTDVAILNYLQESAEAAGVTKLEDITAHDMLAWDLKHPKLASNLEKEGVRAIINHSVDTLIKTATDNAEKARSDILTLEHVEQAFAHISARFRRSARVQPKNNTMTHNNAPCPYKKDAVHIALSTTRHFITLAIGCMGFIAGMFCLAPATLSVCLFWSTLVTFGLSVGAGLLHLMRAAGEIHHKTYHLNDPDVEAYNVYSPVLRAFSAAQILLFLMGVGLLCLLLSCPA